MPDHVIRRQGTFPGVPGFEAVTYNCLAGPAPGMIDAVTPFPPTQAPAVGTFVLTDGTRTITLRDCKFHRKETAVSDSGQMHTMTLMDRRWRWQTGAISGSYNTRDSRGNLIPWKAKNPTELAILCLQEMGETGYKIDLPKGVDAHDLDTTNDNPAPGESTPPTRANPPIEWVDEVPAVALARLCDIFNRRLVFCPVRDIVVIARAGDGAALPTNDFLDSVTDAIEAPATPPALGVVGDKFKVQMRLKLEPVGREWDGRILPVEDLSYRPEGGPRPGKYSVAFTTADGGGPYTASLLVHGFPVSVSAGDGPGLASGLASAVTAVPQLYGVLTAGVGFDLSTLVINGIRDGEEIKIAVLSVTGPARAKLVVEQVPTSSCWESNGGGFGHWFGVRATDRLDYNQARELAVQSVGRMFRVANDDVSNGWGQVAEPKKIYVPLFGEVDRRQNLEVTATKVAQAQPEKPNAGNIDLKFNLPAQPVDYYDGYSRDQGASVHGAICTRCAGRWWAKDGGDNTPAGSAVPVPFTVDPDNQLVIFNEPVYRQFQPSSVPGGELFPRLVLETGVYPLNNKTFAAERYRRWISFAKPAPGTENADKNLTVDLSGIGIREAKPLVVKLPKRRDNITDDEDPPAGTQWYSHDDVRPAVIAEYDYDAQADKHTLRTWDVEPYTKQMIKAADQYIGDHYLEHIIEGGQTAGYFGIQLVEMDGAISQVTWATGGRHGTTASRNTQHGFATLPYPLQRREENQRADAERTALNFQSEVIGKPVLVGQAIANILK